MKKLGQKNLFYSILLAAAMMLFLVGYFALMLPSLYVDYVAEQNLEAIKKQHKAFVENGSYDGVKVKNPTACVSIKIPLDDNYIEMTSKMVSVKITVAEPEMKMLLENVQNFIRRWKEGRFEDLHSDSLYDDLAQEKLSSEQLKEKRTKLLDDQLKKSIDRWQEKLLEIFENYVRLPVEVDVKRSDNNVNLYDGESFKMHYVSSHTMVLEFSVEDDENRYTNYLAIENMADEIVLSVLPVITPEMEEIRPIVMQSLPMLGAVILMLTLIFSRIYSGGIVLPVYQKLENMNESLKEENERQEVFMRASSHQLKTPITAALLLLDGMINQVGKYKDTQAYLPKVKEQLLSMRRMVEEILSLNQNREELNICEINLYELVQDQLNVYHVAAADRQLQVVLEGDQDICICADRQLLSNILGNLLSNAVNYTPAGAKIDISVEKQKIVIFNSGTAIPQEIMMHIFEPFVRGEHNPQSHGLGLYIASYYAKLAGIELSVLNKDNGVESVMEFELR